MELKYTTTLASVFLILLLISKPESSKGVSMMVDDDTEGYEIDYSGPRSHSSIPPPDHSRTNKPVIRQESTAEVEPPKCEGLRLSGCNVAANGKKIIHG